MEGLSSCTIRNAMLTRLTAWPLVFFSLAANAQTDSIAPYKAAVNNAIDVYRQYRGTESNLYIGPAVEQSNFSGKGTPYYGSGDWFTGSVLYDDALYENVLLRYDLVRDELVAQNPTTRNAFYLFKERVGYFTLGDKTFINLKKSGHKSSPAEGYYQLLAQGSMTLLKKLTKSYQESFVAGSVEQRYDEKTVFYALKDNVYHELSNAKSLYSLAGTYKNQIKDAIKKGGRDSDKNLELMLTSIAQYYNQLNQ